jgi:hypothetical protein
LTIDTSIYNYTNIDACTDIHPIIVVARVLGPTHTAKYSFEDVRRVVVITVTLCDNGCAASIDRPSPSLHLNIESRQTPLTNF